ncbi:cyclic peptide export ABC transporter [Hyalangium versicolor]|uniref:cyclic peptide export ABC transporter n=1 Tax=Hyalangium versicolor TaxID=2861190 RepID=UPI001CCC70BE|nr:cyclic peptide export ABC transporter [Hyalangium versicolor]
MKELLRLISSSRRTAILSLLLGVVSGACGAGLIWLISDTLSRDFTSTGYLFAAVALFSLLTRIAFMSLLSRLQQGAIFNLRRHLSRRILATPLRILEEVGTPRLQATLTADIFALGEGLRLFPSFFISLTSAVGCLVYLAWLSWSAFLALLAFGTLGVLSYWLPTQSAVRVSERARAREDDLFKYIRSLTEGAKELGLNQSRRKAFLAECLDPTADDLRRFTVRTHDIYGATSSWGLFLFFLLIGLVLFVLPHFSQQSVRVLTGYVFAILYLQQPLAGILEALPALNQGGVALRRIQSLGLAPATEPAGPHLLPAGEATPAFQHLSLNAVTHAYHREQEDDRFTLGPIDLSLRQGELVFLIGGNGSGKTTLAKLITGLYAPEGGELRLNGKLIAHENREEYRQYFSAVFSDFHLFESLLGAPSDPETLARIQGYLTRLHLDRKVRITQGRFSTTSLSQGQRKRLALLASYIEDRPIYVFDEWAADQDPTFKAVFYEELLPELKSQGKTVLVITHDDRYFHIADRILRLEAGKLVSPPPALGVQNFA